MVRFWIYYCIEFSFKFILSLVVLYLLIIFGYIENNPLIALICIFFNSFIKFSTWNYLLQHKTFIFMINCRPSDSLFLHLKNIFIFTYSNKMVIIYFFMKLVYFSLFLLGKKIYQQFLLKCFCIWILWEVLFVFVAKIFIYLWA